MDSGIEAKRSERWGHYMVHELRVATTLAMMGFSGYFNASYIITDATTGDIIGIFNDGYSAARVAAALDRMDTGGAA